MRVFGSSMAANYYRVYMTDDVDWIQRDIDKWNLGETIWTYAGFLDLTYTYCLGYNYP